eukprot:CAMPEP_0197825232 /NCGR_PEP_ID=MMETSP1437-20131217/2349_1 /TAXON_ID=49252 ORGANISM="Eucampia antarctica, Strain CCMP1452" /NCGR_SAMPLE_ID=MMETSP1437 /ASSEMBLY_ACC=CAM_ASM_001096 /LENGTH=188 /DNA_ID=CAMNT_0043425145 /DNA_START=74 /DNA_END=640 /DNA_ORIENTATION=+
MGKTSASATKKASATSKSRRRSVGDKKEVKVLVAPSAFPDFSEFSNPNSTPRKDRDSKHSKKEQLNRFLDFDQAIGEIHALGSTQFTGKQKKAFEADQYKSLTGRDKKKQKTPQKVMRGIKKKAAQRNVRIVQEAKESGVVSHTLNNGMKKEKKRFSEKNRRDSWIHGPAPSAGFMTKGVLNVKQGEN